MFYHQIECSILCSKRVDCYSFQFNENEDENCKLGKYHEKTVGGSEACYVDTEGFSGTLAPDEVITTMPVFGPGFEITFEFYLNSNANYGWSWILSIR